MSDKTHCCFIPEAARKVLANMQHTTPGDVLAYIAQARCAKDPRWVVYPDAGSSGGNYRYYQSCDEHVADFLNADGRSVVHPMVAPAEDHDTAEG